LANEPYVGFQEKGLKGLMSGTGKGVFGVVTLPALGLIDLVTNMAVGVKNTAALFGKPDQKFRKRTPTT